MTAVLAVSWRWRSAFIGRVRGCMLRGSETWPVKKENKLTLQRAEMRMIRWMCNRFTCSELRQRLGIGDIITVIQRHRLRWYGHVLRKNKNEGVKKSRILKWRGRSKKPWSDVIEKDSQTRQICNEDAVNREKWRKLIKDVVCGNRTLYRDENLTDVTLKFQ